MSRMAKKPLAVPEKVEVAVQGASIQVKGPLGSLATPIPEGISVEIKDGNVTINRENDWPSRRAYQGLAFSLLRNAFDGVTKGFKKELDIVGIGYKAILQGKTLVLSLGYSHDINFEIPEDIKIEVPAQNKIIISGSDKQQVGQVAAKIRDFRKPEVYKGKGIKYSDEIIRKKVGKAAL